MVSRETYIQHAHSMPSTYSDDIRSPFRYLGMGDWSDEKIGEYFEGKQVIDIGSGFEGLARRLYTIFKDSKNAPSVVNLNPQFTDWAIKDMRVDGATKSVRQSKKLVIEAGIKEVMESDGEDFEGYMAQRTAVAGVVQQLDFEDGYFDIQISTWAFPNLQFDRSASTEWAVNGYREILRTQRVGGVALLAPIRSVAEQTRVRLALQATGMSHTVSFNAACHVGEVAEIKG